MIVTLLKANDIAGIFTLLKDSANDLLVHDGLYEYATDLEQYFIIKAFKIADIEAFTRFGMASSSSSYGSKQIFHRVLNIFYKVPPYYLEYNHDPKDGIPGLQTYIDVANNILNSKD